MNLELQRATQHYMDSCPALSLYAIVKSQIRDLGFRFSSQTGVEAGFMFPGENYLIENGITVYAISYIDLKIDGRRWSRSLLVCPEPRTMRISSTSWTWE